MNGLIAFTNLVRILLPVEIDAERVSYAWICSVVTEVAVVA